MGFFFFSILVGWGIVVVVVVDIVSFVSSYDAMRCDAFNDLRLKSRV